MHRLRLGVRPRGDRAGELVGVHMGAMRVDVPAVEEASEPARRLTGLLSRILEGHGGRVELATLDGREHTAVTVEMPGANPLLVTVSEP